MRWEAPFLSLFVALGGGPGCSATLALEPGSPEAREASTTKTVGGEELPAIEGRIRGSDRSVHVVVRSDDGRTMDISRQSVRDIDHPGNVLALAGLGPLLVGAVLLPLSFYVSYNCLKDSPSGDCTVDDDFRPLLAPAILSLGAGGAAGVTGLVIWRVSVDAAEGPD